MVTEVSEIMNKTTLKAIYLAGMIHQNQKYGDGELYFNHLYKVDQVLSWAGYPELSDERIAAWLHDTMEDGNLKKEEICEYFHSHIAQIVQAVTNEPGETRKEKDAKTYPKIAKLKSALVVKLADRIANVESSINSRRFARIYIKDHNFFVESFVGIFVDEKLLNLWSRYDLAIDRIVETFEGIK